MPAMPAPSATATPNAAPTAATAQFVYPSRPLRCRHEQDGLRDLVVAKLHAYTGMVDGYQLMLAARAACRRSGARRTRQGRGCDVAIRLRGGQVARRGARR